MSPLLSTGLFLFISGFLFGWIGHRATRCLRGWVSHQFATRPESGAGSIADSRTTTSDSHGLHPNMTNSNRFYAEFSHQTFDRISNTVMVVGPVTITALV